MNPQTKEQLRLMIKKYGTAIKRGLVILFSYLMILSISSYFTYETIIKNTIIIQEQAQIVRDEISYFNHFQLKYLNSEYAKKFLAHENNILEAGEALIAFQQTTPPAEILSNQTIQEQKTPREERKLFFAEKLEK